MSDIERCDVPPEGWWCSREKGHDGPCAAREVEPMSWEDLAKELQAEKIALHDQLAGAVAALRESAGTLHRVSSWWVHAEWSFGDCPAESCVKARAALGGQCG